MNQIFRGKKGFTLVEIAIVLIIIGLLLGVGANMIGPLTKRVKLNETRETINADVESVVGYAASNQKIPDNVTAFQGIVKNPKDAWTKPIYYFFDPYLTKVGSVCSRQTTNLTICRNAACTNTTPNVAFITISGGDNYNPQTGIITPAGCPAGQTCIGIYDADTANADNCTTTTNCPDTNFPSTEDRMNRATDRYDDVVKWVTLNELQTKTGCMSTQSQLRITNQSLPQNYVCDAYPPASVYAEGGIPFGVANQDYRWCIQNTTGTAPANLIFRDTADSANIVFDTNCLGLTETSWTQSSTVLIKGNPTPNQAGVFNLTYYVRDNNDSARQGIVPASDSDNYTSKNLLLTINPSMAPFCPDSTTGTCLTGCSVTFRNSSTGSVRIVGGTHNCTTTVAANGTLAVTGLSACGTIVVHSTTTTCTAANYRASIQFPGPINSGGTVTYTSAANITCPP